MNLLEICDPLLQYVCDLNRLGRTGGHRDAEVVRGDIERLLTETGAAAAAAGLAEQFARIELPLIFFADSMIARGRMPFAAHWQPIAAQRNQQAGEERFFDLLEEALADPSHAATQRLAVFHACLGLGFTGWYEGQDEYLRNKSREVWVRVAAMADPQADWRPNEQAPQPQPPQAAPARPAQPQRPPAGRWIGVLAALVFLAGGVLAANVLVYRHAAGDLQRTVRTIASRQPAPAHPADANSE